MAGAAFSPISLLLLPKTSNLAAEKQYDTIFSKAGKTLMVTLFMTITAVIIFEIFAFQIINLYLKNASSDLIYTARIIAFGIPGYTIYIVLRSILDALHYKAINTRNVLITFGIYSLGVVILMVTGFNDIVNTIIFSFSVTMLGVLTYFDLLRSKRFFLNK
jgi:O-antigen/teichoic acid export membrane protein